MRAVTNHSESPSPSARPTSRVMRSAMALTLLLSLPLLAGQDAAPDADQANGEPAPAQVALDIQTMLLANELIASQVTGPVWQFSAGPNRQLLYLPLRFEAGQEQTDFSRPPVDIRGGRFLAWHVTDQDTAARSGRAARTQRAYAPPIDYWELEDDWDDYGDPSPRRSRQTATTSRQEQDAPEPFDPNAPRFARSITILTDGQVQWNMDRGFPGGEVRQGNEDYKLKIDPQRLRDIEPQRPGATRSRTPDRTSRDDRASRTDSRQQAEQQRQAMLQYTEQMRAHQQRATAIRQLPETFTLDTSQRLWALFDLSANARELIISAPGFEPWSLAFDDLQMLRELARRGAGSGPLDADTRARISRMQLLVAEQHPLTTRLIAHALAHGQLAGRSTPNDGLYNLMQTIINGDDPDARHAIVAGLSEVASPTQATLMLLHMASAHADPQTKLLALRGMFQVDLNDPLAVRSMLDATSRALADPAGPDAGEILRELAHRVGNHENTLAAATASVDFQFLSPSRQDDAIAFIIREAATYPLAASWMNHRLLGSVDPQVVRRTLQLLDGADTGPNALTPATQNLIFAVFGPPADHAQPSDTLQLQMAGRVPIHTADHRYFRALTSSDQATRNLAWNVLGKFRFAEPDPRDRRGRVTSRRTTDNDAQTDRYARLLEAAQLVDPLPVQLPTFLADQPDEQRATWALLAVAAMDDETGSRRAARLLLGSGRPVADMIDQHEPEVRHRAAAAMYLVHGQAAPLSVGLVRDAGGRNSPGRWFGQRASAGDLPEPREWIDAYRRQDDLLNLTGAADQQLAQAAVAALIYAAGGDDELAQHHVQRFTQRTDRSRQALSAWWSETQRDIYARQLANAAGQYRLVVYIRGVSRQMQSYDDDDYYYDDYDDYYTTGAPSTLPIQSQIVLGVVELSVQGQNLQLGANQTVRLSVPDDELAIHLDQPSELKNFPNDEIAQLPLEDIRRGINLLPHADGSWRGQATFRDQRILEVRLEPVNTP